MSQHAQALAAGTVVFRLVRPIPDFLPQGGPLSGNAFRPSKGDIEQAAERQQPVRVSVWDRAHTTTAQGTAFRAGVEVVVFDLRVDDVCRLGASLGEPRLRVVHDELDEPERSRPGADGHSGIEGLDQAPGEPKLAWKERLRKLALLARLAP